MFTSHWILSPILIELSQDTLDGSGKYEVLVLKISWLYLIQIKQQNDFESLKAE